MKPLLKHNPRQPDLCSSVGIAIEINFENICTTRLREHPMIVNAARATQVAVIAPLLHKIILQFPVPYCSLLSPLLKQNQKLNTSEWAGCSAEHTEVPCWKGKASTLKRAFQFIFSKPSALRILCSCRWKREAFYPKGYRGKGGWHSQLTSLGCPHSLQCWVAGVRQEHRAQVTPLCVTCGTLLPSTLPWVSHCTSSIQASDALAVFCSCC